MDNFPVSCANRPTTARKLPALPYCATAAADIQKVQHQELYRARTPGFQFAKTLWHDRTASDLAFLDQLPPGRSPEPVARADLRLPAWPPATLSCPCSPRSDSRVLRPLHEAGIALCRTTSSRNVYFVKP